MKLSILTITFFLFFKCSLGQTFEIYKGDTINYTDENNLKQGLWIYFYDQEKKQISQKGIYKNSKKNGIWETYYQNGNLKSKINYKDNRQYGQIELFYPNGNLQETGFWKTNKWVGEYKFYYPNGKIKYHWFFDNYGKRTGQQQYFYANGKPQIIGEWIEGKEKGEIKEFYENGNLKKVSNFENGILNGTVSEYYSDGQLKSKSLFINGVINPAESYVYEKKTDTATSSVATEIVITTKTKNQDSSKTGTYKIFSGNGYYKFINEQGYIEREGIFKNGILIDGKRYLYNENGEKIKTVIIKNGKVDQIINEKTNN